MKKDKFLESYRKEVKRFLSYKGHYIPQIICLDDEFLKICEARIMAGRITYGDDWKTKDCLKERQLELYDYFNYTILDELQKKYRKQNKK